MPTLTTLSNVVFSAYCACRICCGPDASGVTSIGSVPKEGRTIAGPRNIPLGLQIKLSGPAKVSGVYRVEDRTAKKWDGKRWDIYFRNHEAAKKFGIQRGTVVLVGMGEKRLTKKKK